MRRPRRKIVVWLVLTVISLNPLLGVLAIDAEMSQALADYQAAMADSAAIGAVHHEGNDSTMDCAQQHEACIAYCQFTSLQPTDSARIPGSPLAWFVSSGEPDNLATRFLDCLERPPRV